jgi:glucosylceramidase
MGCSGHQKKVPIEVWETAANGNNLKKITEFPAAEGSIDINIFPDKEFQTIIGFGGSFTESSAYLLNQLSKKNRDSILVAYFGKTGNQYTLTRTHINSCDFSLGHYAYVSGEVDTSLSSFSIHEDKDDLIPMIKDAMQIAAKPFKIIASPWTAPPWMKDNNDWRGGKLLPQYYDTWALYFSKYLDAYRNEGIDIWGITVENEPLGNNNNWESMHYTPQEMVEFTNNHLGPMLEKNHADVKILAYDQNRGEELEEWARVIYHDQNSSRYVDGFAVHWYASTYAVFGESLRFTHDLAPDKLLIQTEACVDSEVPRWRDDQWYWSKEATDWGWDWAPEEEKDLHPKYVPVYRYARDIIGCLNNQVQGWIDWNMVLDKQGGPNWFENWCVAPVIVDPQADEIYFTPLYYVLGHFSRFIYPGAVRIGFDITDENLLLTATKNPDGSIAIVLLNMSEEPRNFNLVLKEQSYALGINARAMQTIFFPANNLKQ